MRFTAQVYKKVLWLALAVGLLIPTVALAAEGALVKDEQVGPYHISIWVRPNPIAVGNVHMFIRLGQKVNVAQEMPVRDAKVTLRFQHLTGPGTEAKPSTGYQQLSTILIASEAEPGTYEAADSLVARGDYRALITIERNGQKVDYNFDFYAQEQGDDRFISVTILVLIALFIFSLAFIYMKQSGEAANEKEKQDQLAEVK